jgi:tRNA (guanine10-N2)-dimethyltransferase
MPFFLFKLSGESIELGLQELGALLWPKKLELVEQFGSFVLAKAKISEHALKSTLERSSFIKFAALVVRKLNGLLLEELSKVNWSFVESPFCVRVINLTEHGPLSLEAKLAAPIYDYLWHHRGKIPKVSLSAPKTIVLFLIREKDIFVCKKFWESKKGKFAGREPAQKPVFHPTSLKPKLALLLVNLSRVKKGQSLLDPFCGTGSVLIEAGLIGCKPIGIDLDEKMVSGAKTNLDFYGVKAKLLVGNALELQKYFKPNSIDGIATDPPYGRSTKIGAKSLNELYKGFFSSAFKVLKKGKFLSIIYPHYVPAKKFIDKAKWSVVFETQMKVHGGLTRKFLVLQKR